MWDYFIDCQLWSLFGLLLGYLIGRLHAPRKDPRDHS